MSPSRLVDADEVDLNGQSAWHGPVAIEQSSDSGVSSSWARNAALLNNLGKDESLDGRGIYKGPEELRAEMPEMTPARFEIQSNLAEQRAVKLAIKQEGWYRVSAQELFQAGLDTKTDPRNLQLFVEGEEVAIAVAGEQDRKLDATDTVEFYATGLNSTASGTRVYWLIADSTGGQRIGKVKGKGKAAGPGAFQCVVERHDRTIYFSALRRRHLR